MRTECTVELSRDNFDAAIETFLRSVNAIHDDETPRKMEYYPGETGDSTTRIKIHFQ